MTNDSDPMSSRPLLAPHVLINIEEEEPNKDTPSSSTSPRSTPYALAHTAASPPNKLDLPPCGCSRKHQNIDIEAQTICCACHLSSSPPFRPVCSPINKTTHISLGFGPNPNSHEWLPFQAHFSFGLAPPSMPTLSMPSLGNDGWWCLAGFVAMACFTATMIVLIIFSNK